MLYTVEKYADFSLKEIIGYSDRLQAELSFSDRLNVKKGETLRLVQAPRTVLKEKIGG